MEGPEFDPVLDLGFDPTEARGKQRHYLEALADHLDLLHWMRTPVGTDELSSLLMSTISGWEHLDRPKAEIKRQVSQAARATAKGAAAALNAGDTFYVAPSMVTMVEAASDNLPDETVTSIHDLPSTSGWVRFGRPLDLDWQNSNPMGESAQETKHWLREELGLTNSTALTERPAPLAVRGFSWWTQKQADGSYQMNVVWMVHRDDRQDPISKAEWCVTRDVDLMLEWITIPDPGESEPEPNHDRRQELVEELLDGRAELARRWDSNERWMIDGHTSWTIGKRGVGEVGITAKIVQTLFLLMQQPIGAVTGAGPDKRLRKQAGRQFGEVPEIRVVLLRRRVARDPEKAGDHVEVNWSHRWVVQGHWRNQWYASEGRHRRIWVAPFIKGPEALPVVVKDTVYALER